MIELSFDEAGRQAAVRRARQRGIVLPTLAQMRDPSRAPAAVRQRLARIGLWDIDPVNLFRISWHNEPAASGGGFGPVNTLEFPPSLTGVPARVIGLIGRWFPTGCHKVGAAFGCLVPRLVTGRFDPARQRAVWPSTGNYCRGGAYVSAVLGCESIAVLPEGMSRERFDWLSRIAGEVIPTPGSESNVKEIFDAIWELRRTRDDVVVLNQFDEFGNYLWHHEVTGPAMLDVLERELRPGQSVRGLVLTAGSAGTLAAGDFLKPRVPHLRLAVGEALQCPTLMENGFGAHRIEGIGDKHVPWIHNVRNTDVVMSIDEQTVLGLARLFNEPAGRTWLVERGVPGELADRLDLLGFSGLANLAMAVKFARYFELGPEDVILTVLTDSMELYASRLAELRARRGDYSERDAISDHARYLLALSTDNLLELRHTDRRRIHNLKYFTWVEQQGRSADELSAQWRDPGYWTAVQRQADRIDELIDEFNARTGLAPG